MRAQHFVRRAVVSTVVVMMVCTVYYSMSVRVFVLHAVYCTRSHMQLVQLWVHTDLRRQHLLPFVFHLRYTSCSHTFTSTVLQSELRISPLSQKNQTRPNPTY